MQNLAKFDPYSIKQIQFYSQKRSKFTTLKSILISLIIIILTIIVNIEIIKNLWAPKNQLQIQENQIKSNQPLSSNFICVISQVIGSEVPQSNLSNIEFYPNSSFKGVFKFFYKDNKINLPENVLKVINGRSYQCYDMQGTVLEQNKLLKLTVYGPYDVVFQMYNLAEILEEENTNFFYFNKNFGLTQYQTFLNVKKIKSVVYNRLWVDYQPQIRLGIEKIAIMQNSRTVSLNNNENVFYLNYNYKTDFSLTKQITLIRKNIGEIIGKCLSWFTIFVLIFTFIISPVVQLNFKLILAQSLYQNFELHKIQSSMLSFFKYILSFVIKNKFNEEVIHHVNQNLQKDLNLINMIKRQQLIKKLISENQNFQRNHEEYYIFEQDHQNNQISSYLDQDTSTNNNQNILNNHSNKSYKQTKTFNIEQDPEKQSKNIVFNFIKSLDIGETAISLLSNKGQGYRNKWNPILTILFSVLLLSFLIFAGFFNIQSEYKLKTVLQGRNVINSITIQPNDMIFKAIKGPLDRWNFKISIYDQNYNVIENVSLLTGSQCSEYVKNLEQTGSQWMCLSQPLVLSSGYKNSKRSLSINLQPTIPFAFTLSLIEVTYIESNFQNGRFYQKIQRIKQGYRNDEFLKFSLKILYDTENDKVYYMKYLQNLQLFMQKNGIGIELIEEITNIEQQSNTLWDVIDNSWGLFIICFTLILQKMTHYLNVREREKITSSQQNENRNDIVQIVKTQHLLQNKFFKKQLESVKYFFKQNI